MACPHVSGVVALGISYATQLRRHFKASELQQLLIDTTVDIVMPTDGKITSQFGYRYHPITGKFGIHNGTDIAAPEGTPIYAAFNGRVEEIGYNSVRGNYILLSHGGDTQTLYLHCSEIVAPEGAVVRQGEIIAKVGNTGYSTGPHLHFEVRINGVRVDPERLLYPENGNEN